MKAVCWPHGFWKELELHVSGLLRCDRERQIWSNRSNAVRSDFVDGSLVVSLWNSNPPFGPITMIQWNATKETLYLPRARGSDSREWRAETLFGEICDVSRFLSDERTILLHHDPMLRPQMKRGPMSFTSRTNFTRDCQADGGQFFLFGYWHTIFLSTHSHTFFSFVLHRLWDLIAESLKQLSSTTWVGINFGGLAMCGSTNWYPIHFFGFYWSNRIPGSSRGDYAESPRSKKPTPRWTSFWLDQVPHSDNGHNRVRFHASRSTNTSHTILHDFATVFHETAAITYCHKLRAGTLTTLRLRLGFGRSFGFIKFSISCFFSFPRLFSFRRTRSCSLSFLISRISISFIFSLSFREANSILRSKDGRLCESFNYWQVFSSDFLALSFYVILCFYLVRLLSLFTVFVLISFFFLSVYWEAVWSLFFVFYWLPHLHLFRFMPTSVNLFPSLEYL